MSPSLNSQSATRRSRNAAAANFASATEGAGGPTSTCAKPFPPPSSASCPSPNSAPRSNWSARSPPEVSPGSPAGLPAGSRPVCYTRRHTFAFAWGRILVRGIFDVRCTTLPSLDSDCALLLAAGSGIRQRAGSAAAGSRHGSAARAGVAGTGMGGRIGPRADAQPGAGRRTLSPGRRNGQRRGLLPGGAPADAGRALGGLEWRCRLPAGRRQPAWPCRCCGAARQPAVTQSPAGIAVQ